MSMKYIRNHYCVPADLGVRVTFAPDGGPARHGVIVGKRGQYLRVKMDDGETLTLHPTWRVTYHEIPAEDGKP